MAAPIILVAWCRMVMAICKASRVLVAKIASESNKSVSDLLGRSLPRLKTARTPYCMRHRAASDFRASGMRRSEVSAALGHLSDVTKSTYGSARMSKAGGVAPAKVEAALEVKTKKPTAKAKKRTAEINGTGKPASLNK